MRTGRSVKFIQLFTFLFTITGILPARAQQFTWQAALPAIEKTGFYNVILRPEFVAKSHDTALTDVRIFDGETVVTYILQRDSQYVALPSPVIATRNDAVSKQTILRLQFKEEYLIQQLELTVAGPAFYRRSLFVTEDSGSTDHCEQFAIVSGQPASLRLPTPLKTKQCYIVIRNEDNPALEIKDITAFQKHIYLTAWLEKGKNYLLKTGDRDLPAPVYDLPYFANKVPGNITTLETGNIAPIPAVIKSTPSRTAETNSTVFKSKGWIWAGIGSIIVLISLLTIRLLRDMRERK
jgi:hypothetical protein